MLTFKRAVVVDTQADLGIQISARTIGVTSALQNFSLLLGTALLLVGLAWFARRPAKVA
jgi:hypothetical protein